MPILRSKAPQELKIFTPRQKYKGAKCNIELKGAVLTIYTSSQAESVGAHRGQYRLCDGGHIVENDAYSCETHPREGGCLESDFKQI